jgi:hypothetical protein
MKNIASASGMSVSSSRVPFFKTERFLVGSSWAFIAIGLVSTALSVFYIVRKRRLAANELQSHGLYPSCHMEKQEPLVAQLPISATNLSDDLDTILAPSPAASTSWKRWSRQE